MLTLGIETSSRLGSVALWEDGRLLGERVLSQALDHGALLFVELRRLHEELHLEPHQVDLIAVSLGPGSFTGLRIGLTTARTAAYVLCKPLLGVGSMDVLAENAPEEAQAVVTALDAKRGEVYACVFRREGRRLRRASPYQVLEPEALDLPAPCHILGDALARYREAFERPGVTLLGEESWRPRASVVARLAAERFAAGERQELHSIEPIYLRRPEAEEVWERKHGKS